MILSGTMEKTDYLSLSGKQLNILVTIHRAGSLSLAAKLLGMNQSTLSYWLDQLRDRFGDALFVRVGQGMQPTERMARMIGPANEILSHLNAIMETDGYDPTHDNGVLRLACSALERDLIVQPLIRQAVTEAPNVTFDVSEPGSGFQIADRLREGSLDFAFYPGVFERGDDLLQRVLYPVEDVVFFDPSFPLAEGDFEAYCARPHARVAFGPDADFDLERRLAKAGSARHVGLQAADFDALASLIRGTPNIATVPLHMQFCSFCDLDWVLAPLPNDPLDMVLYWHARHKSSDRLRFWRRKIFDLASLTGGRLKAA